MQDVDMQEIIAETTEMPWEAATGYRTGTQWKILRRGSQGEAKSVLLKLKPGFELPAHSHTSTEHHYVINGEYESQGQRFAAGTYRVIPRHMDHGPFRSENGAELLVVWED